MTYLNGYRKSEDSLKTEKTNKVSASSGSISDEGVQKRKRKKKAKHHQVAPEDVDEQQEDEDQKEHELDDWGFLTGV